MEYEARTPAAILDRALRDRDPIYMPPPPDDEWRDFPSDERPIGLRDVIDEARDWRTIVEVAVIPFALAVLVTWIVGLAGA